MEDYTHGQTVKDFKRGPERLNALMGMAVVLFSNGFEKGLAVRDAFELEKIILEEDEKQAIELLQKEVRRRRGH